jgi:hypothetical protein
MMASRTETKFRSSRKVSPGNFPPVPHALWADVGGTLSPYGITPHAEPPGLSVDFGILAFGGVASRARREIRNGGAGVYRVTFCIFQIRLLQRFLQHFVRARYRDEAHTGFVCHNDVAGRYADARDLNVSVYLDSLNAPLARYRRDLR